MTVLRVLGGLYSRRSRAGYIQQQEEQGWVYTAVLRVLGCIYRCSEGPRVGISSRRYPGGYIQQEVPGWVHNSSEGPRVGI